MNILEQIYLECSNESSDVNGSVDLDITILSIESLSGEIERTFNFVDALEYSFEVYTNSPMGETDLRSFTDTTKSIMIASGVKDPHPELIVPSFEAKDDAGGKKDNIVKRIWKWLVDKFKLLLSHASKIYDGVKQRLKGGDKGKVAETKKNLDILEEALKFNVNPWLVERVREGEMNTALPILIGNSDVSLQSKRRHIKWVVQNYKNYFEPHNDTYSSKRKYEGEMAFHNKIGQFMSNPTVDRLESALLEYEKLQKSGNPKFQRTTPTIEQEWMK